MIGREDVMALIRGLFWRKHWPIEADVRLARINGYLGAILATADGLYTLAFQPDGKGRLAAVYLVANPDKLRGVPSP